MYIQPLTQEQRDVSFKTQNVAGYANSDFYNLVGKMFDKILKEENNFISKGSGWCLQSIYICYN